MGWLEDMSNDTIYNYRDQSSGDVIKGTRSQLEDYFGCSLKCEPGEEASLNVPLPRKYLYAGFEPNKLGITTKMTFEKNGRTGVRTRFSDGKQYVRSMTKEQAMKGKGTESVLTKDCKVASEKAKEKYVHKRIKQTINELKHEAHVAKEAKRGGKK